jgi:hypothetical protein
MDAIRNSTNSRRAGVVGVWVVVAFVALAGAAAMSFDLGRLALAAQRSQDVADAAAFAAAPKLPYESDARAAALAVANANNTESSALPTHCTDSDLTFVGPNGTVSGTTLGPYAHALEVKVHTDVDYSFARLFGLVDETITRSATVVRAPIEGVPIATMWIAHETPLNYGDQINLMMASGPHYAGIPGSFGFLQEPPGCTTDWLSLLQGYGLTTQDIESSFVSFGDSVYAKTGVTIGNVKKALVSDGGVSRMERGTTGDFAYDTFNSYDAANPRIMLVPMVSYVGDTGSNAEFKIEKFGAFWLEGFNQGQKEVWGRFIEYDMPGGDPNSQLTSNTGVFASKLMK